MSDDSDQLNLAPAIRAAVIGFPDIATKLSVWNGEAAVFTRRPVPANADYPMAVVSPPISVGDQDGLKVRIPTPRFDLTFFGRQPDDYRVVEQLAYLARRLFHRNRLAIDPGPSYRVIEIVATGPVIAPTDSVELVGRAVLLRFKLEDLTTA